MAKNLDTKAEKKSDKPSPTVTVFKRETLLRAVLDDKGNPVLDETGTPTFEPVDALVKLEAGIPGRDVYAWIRGHGADGSTFEFGRMRSVSLSNVVVKAHLVVDGKTRNSNPGPRKPKAEDAAAKKAETAPKGSALDKAKAVAGKK